MNNIKLFQDKKIRSVWNEEEEQWYFSVVDVVEALTDSSDPKQYIKKMRTRDPQLNTNWGTICTLVQMPALDGKSRKIDEWKKRGITEEKDYAILTAEISKATFGLTPVGVTTEIPKRRSQTHSPKARMSQNVEGMLPG